MARRSGQVGYEEVKRGWFHVRFRMYVPGREKRAYLSKPICPISGPGFLTKPERFRLRKQIIAASGADTEEHFNKVEALDGQQRDSGRQDGRGFRRQREWRRNPSEKVEPRIHRPARSQRSTAAGPLQRNNEGPGHLASLYKTG